MFKNYLKEGKELIAHGRLTLSGKKRKILHPEIEVISPDPQAAIHLDRITPIYPSTTGLNQRVIRSRIHGVLHAPDFDVVEMLPLPGSWISAREAYQAIHFPASWAELEEGRQRLAFEELFLMQILLAKRRQSVAVLHKDRAMPPPTGSDQATASLSARWLASLPYQPTGAQRRVFTELDADLSKPRPMNRLLQGDVGSGKTLVACYAMLKTLEAGSNAALLAPTETLAEQHARNFRQLLEPLGIRVELWTRTRKPSGTGLFAVVGTVYVGTHALFQEKVVIPRLGLGVIDEQHKFGVLQRRAFLAKGDNPDLLVMTATPIPRTLCLTLYGDLDVSILDEMPPGRREIKTVLRSEEELPKVWFYIQSEIKKGRQAYVVYPVLEESEKLDLKSVTQAYKQLQEIFGKNEVVMLHGKMDAEEKRRHMAEFRAGQKHVMVATSVIEVGVDVPRATMMVIEHAERFGLAQLHQLRGRVGRSDLQSYCVLVGEPKSEESWKRLKIMEETQDGFKLAEEDLKIRGPGNILGAEQSGLPPLRVANLGKDMKLLSEARQHAQRLMEQDPALKAYPRLRERLNQYAAFSGHETAN
ncbi:MAG: ATP-dependent DNA helicase RecG [Blastochloris sp.]|nr:ATP-dependent DNA helicase RecG [Blastochloris sp.]